MIRTAHREHHFCYGHRVAGHENKCANLHGHNGRVVFHVASPDLDKVGRVVDFSVIDDKLCNWLEQHWDHKMLLWDLDELISILNQHKLADVNGVISVPFNPTAENMAEYLLQVVGPALLPKPLQLVKVEFFETAKCGVTVEREYV